MLSVGGVKLAPVLGHPGSALFALAGEEISVEHGQEAVVTVKHLIGLHLRVEYGNVGALVEPYAVESAGECKDTVTHTV